MTFRELFYRVKIKASKSADWNVLKTAFILIILIGLIAICYWLYSKHERYKSLIFYSNQQYFEIAKNVFYEECIANGKFISKQLLKNNNNSSLYEVCSYDSVQSASMFSSFKPKKVSFWQYLRGTFPILYSSEQVEAMARKSAIEYENRRVEFSEKIKAN